MKPSTWIKAALVVGLGAALATWPPLREFAASLHPERIEAWLAEAGALAPLLLVGLMAAAVVVSPIPSLPLDVAAGAFFGPLLGTVYAVLGALVGALASFWIARLLGRELLERFLGGHINFCAACSDKLLTRVVFVSRLIPFVSFDVVSYGAGLTKMSAQKFALATGLGMIPLTFVYTSFGSAFRVDARVAVVVGAALVALFFFLPRWIERSNFLSLRRHFEGCPAAERPQAAEPAESAG